MLNRTGFVCTYSTSYVHFEVSKKIPLKFKNLRRKSYILTFINSILYHNPNHQTRWLTAGVIYPSIFKEQNTQRVLIDEQKRKHIAISFEQVVAGNFKKLQFGV